jgi:hypothetical protein
MKASSSIAAVLIILSLSACQNRYRSDGVASQSVKSPQVSPTGITNGDSYQVVRHEYDQNFQTRYGLLYLTTSDDPFTGRILTIDAGENGDFVYSDEQWKNGRKHGKSSKWFTNGVKMYERNYREGKWHGTVTRWWPNGQKMYVRGYTNGVRHGKEATWRSDGSPLSGDEPVPSNVQVLSSEVDSNPTQLPSVALPDLDGDDSSFSTSPTSQETENSPTEMEELPSISPESLEELSPLVDVDVPSAIEQQTESDEIALPAIDDVEGLTELPSSDAPLPDLPSLPDSIEEPELLDDLPLANEQAEELPGLPVFPGESTEELPDLPTLDGVGGEDELPGLPPLPGGMGDDSLPPLPTDDGGLDDLPPLPPLP